MDNHRYFMKRALVYARRGLGGVSPNPLVGALVVREGQIVGTGFHQQAGGAHAETVALDNAGELAQGATLYVTLEPCNHHGKTPPCVERIVASGIRTVVYAHSDPNPNVRGGGGEYLRLHGVNVITGVCEQMALTINSAWIASLNSNRPYVILKLAQSLDGKIAFPSGVSQWISNAAARRQVHRLRGTVDAVMVGATTAEVDRPSLTNRGSSGDQPHRIIIDGSLRVPLDLPALKPSSSKRGLVRSAFVVTTETADSVKKQALRELGVVVLETSARNGHVDLRQALGLLRERGIFSVICEGGGLLSGALIEAELCDSVVLYQAPFFIGELGVSGFSVPGVVLTGAESDKKRFAFELRDLRQLAGNTRMIFERSVCSAE